MPTTIADPDFDASLTGEAVSHVVFRYDPDSGIILPLPNIRCLSISCRVGAEPWSARFRYVFDQRLNPLIYPSSFEQVFALSLPGEWAASPFVVRHEDRLIVRRPLPNGTWQVLFDGFARLPQVDYSPSGELVTFECVGTPERCWDHPVPGALMRDAPVVDPDPDPAPEEGDPTPILDGTAVWTDLPTRFNPDGLPNATPHGADHLIRGAIREGLSPIFVDAERLKNLSGDQLADVGRHWSLAMACRYLILCGNVDQIWVANPDLEALDIALSAVRPAENWSYIDWSSPETYVIEPIRCPDFDATGLSWVEAIQQLLEPFGFTISFDLTTVGGLPRWELLIRRNDDHTYWKTLGLQPRGVEFDPALNAVIEARIQREGPNGNEVIIDTAPDRVEASFVLAPIGWEPTDDQATPDTDPTHNDRWIRGKPNFDPIKYRVYGLDECGEGHWDFLGGTIVDDVPQGETSYTPADLSVLFPDDPNIEQRTYVQRRRPGFSRLLSQDDQGKPLKAELWFAILDEYNVPREALDDQSPPIPGVWRKLGADEDEVVWQQVTQGGWELLPDRLGIVVTAENARAWEVTRDGAKPIITSGVLDLVQSMRDPSADNPKVPRVVFRLTAVIESDRGIEARAPKRIESPSRYVIQKRVDGRSRFLREAISPYSHINNINVPLYVRDDTKDARRQVESHRRELESVRFSGAIVVPRLTTAIRPCDKVIGFFGRDVWLGGYQPGTDEGPRYPMVVGIEWTLDLPQTTRVMLVDRRSEFAREIEMQV